MHSYADSFEQPVKEKFLNGDGSEHEVTIPLLTQRDYLEWIAELTPKAQERAKKQAPPVTKPTERANWMAMVENIEVTPGDIRPLVLRATGTKRVLEIALLKAKLTKEQAEQFIDSRTVIRNMMLAVQVSGLWRVQEFLEMFPDPRVPQDPNELTAMVKAAVAEAIAPLVDN
jgi:hypothetical protein